MGARNTKLNQESRRFCDYAYKNAMWVYRAIQQRQHNIVQVLKAILEHQPEFINKGLGSLKPLTMRVIAQATGLHESTVSRVIANKTILTPFGLLEPRSFFTAGVKGKKGAEDISSVVVKKLISKLIESEDPQSPLSDDAIAILLKRQGVMAARRTIAKYREAIGVFSSHKRKSLICLKNKQFKH